jgi:hypothetical protein
MRFSSFVAMASLVAASTAAAQGGGAPATASCTGAAGDVCHQAVDFFRYMAPQLGTAITGGNTTIGQGGALGGLRFGFMPRFVVSARVNAVMGNVPKFTPTPGTPAARALTTGKSIVPMPAVDVALGVFKGIPLGVTNVGGVDLLASVSYLPKIDTDEMTITPEASTSIGYGLRIGLLQESLVAPGVGFSFLARSLPVTDLSTSSGSSSFAIDKFDLSSTAWRLTVSKSLLLFGVAAGIGQDKYKTSIGGITAQQSTFTASAPALTSEVTRTNMFADVSMNLFVLKIVASGGMTKGDDIPTFNSFDNPAGKSRTYGSVGVRFGL